MDRQCDVRCHEATHEICTCVCRGKFHGVANRPGGLQAVFATPSVTNLEALVDGSRVVFRETRQLTLSFFEVLPCSSATPPTRT